MEPLGGVNNPAALVLATVRKVQQALESLNGHSDPATESEKTDPSNDSKTNAAEALHFQPVSSLDDALSLILEKFPAEAGPSGSGHEEAQKAADTLASRLQLRVAQLEDRCLSRDEELQSLRRENDALRKTNKAQQAGLDQAAAVSSGTGAQQLWQQKLQRKHDAEVRRLKAEVAAAKEAARVSEAQRRQLEHAQSEQSELGDAQQEIHEKIKQLYKETLLEKEDLEAQAGRLQAELEVESQRSKASQAQVASTLKLTNQLKEYIKNKELECEDLATRLRDTRLKLEAEQARATEEQSVVSSARNSLAVAEVELEVKASQIKELERAKSHEEQSKSDLLQQLYDLQSKFESVQQHEQMCQQQLASANQARKALDERLKTTTQTLLARIEAFEALKEKFAESEATRRKLRKIARTQREKLESSHREIVLFRHHEAWHETHTRLAMHAEERAQRLLAEAERRTSESVLGSPRSGTSRGKPRRGVAMSVGGPFAGGRLNQPRLEERWALYDRELPAPNCTLDSPVIQGLLQSWTRDPQKHNILNQWFRIIESGGAADPSFVRGVELSNLEPAVAKGILRVLVPVLRKSTAMPVVVHTKEVHIVKMDIRLSVDPARVSF
eukprot:INCI4630.2.p1 GENE.INCI4630.2~~INCI4630.2.p1  ORF type:complete len:615 (-),score=128.25 INCI4630.2:218-2062(-)